MPVQGVRNSQETLLKSREIEGQWDRRVSTIKVDGGVRHDPTHNADFVTIQPRGLPRDIKVKDAVYVISRAYDLKCPEGIEDEQARLPPFVVFRTASDNDNLRLLPASTEARALQHFADLTDETPEQKLLNAKLIQEAMKAAIKRRGLNLKGRPIQQNLKKPLKKKRPLLTIPKPLEEKKEDEVKPKDSKNPEEHKTPEKSTGDELKPGVKPAELKPEVKPAELKPEVKPAESKPEVKLSKLKSGDKPSELKVPELPEKLKLEHPKKSGDSNLSKKDPVPHLIDTPSSGASSASKRHTPENLGQGDVPRGSKPKEETSSEEETSDEDDDENNNPYMGGLQNPMMQMPMYGGGGYPGQGYQMTMPMYGGGYPGGGVYGYGAYPGYPGGGGYGGPQGYSGGGGYGGPQGYPGGGGYGGPQGYPGGGGYGAPQGYPGGGGYGYGAPQDQPRPPFYQPPCVQPSGIPKKKKTTKSRQCKAQAIRKKNQGLNFDFLPHDNCCTEVTLTIEPDEPDPLECAVDNGIMPIVCCYMPPTMTYDLNTQHRANGSGMGGRGSHQHPHHSNSGQSGQSELAKSYVTEVKSGEDSGRSRVTGSGAGTRS